MTTDSIEMRETFSRVKPTVFYQFTLSKVDVAIGTAETICVPLFIKRLDHLVVDTQVARTTDKGGCIVRVAEELHVVEKELGAVDFFVTHRANNNEITFSSCSVSIFFC